MEEDYRTSSNFHRYINIVEIRIPSAPPSIKCRDDPGINEFVRTMAKFSIGLSRDLMADRLISSARVRITRSRYATYTDKQHHGISADVLARK